MKPKATYFLLLLLIGGGGIIIAMTSFAGNLGSLIRPLPFSGPNNGIVTDVESEKPISHATIEASWWCHDSFWPDTPGSFYVRAYGITDSMGRFILTKPKHRSVMRFGSEVKPSELNMEERSALWSADPEMSRLSFRLDKIVSEIGINSLFVMNSSLINRCINLKNLRGGE
ncbi:MAG: hypothetical protein HQK66_13130 [Desulfamplus sp.]|nr:hypothetical protein [Desulfamplus sp.]